MSTLSDHDPIEPRLRPWLAEEGMVREPDDLFERVATVTRGVRQRPGWLVRLLGNGMAGAVAGPAARWREHRMATALGLGTIVLAAALGIGTLGPGLLTGGGPAAVSDAPSPSASPGEMVEVTGKPTRQDVQPYGSTTEENGIYQESQAPDATPVAGDGVTVDTLTQVTIAASDLLESVDSIALVHMRLPAESSSTWMHAYTGLQVLSPLGGQLQMPVTGRTEIIRASGDIEALDSGVALTAVPGDTVIGYDLSLPKVYANSAAEPVELLDALFVQGGGGEGDILLVETGSTLELLNGNWLVSYDFGEAGLTGGPLLVTMRRVTLEPGAKIEVEDRYAAVRLVQGGYISRVLLEDGVPTDSPIRNNYHMPYIKAPPGSVIELSNQDSKTAMFYELAIEPASGE